MDFSEITFRRKGMLKYRWMKKGFVLFVIFLLFSLIFETDVFARVGGGGSSGSRGSRSYSQPRSSSPSQPTQPSQQTSPKPSPQASPQTPPPSPAQTPPPQSSFLRGLGGGILGGLLGGMLFSSLGFGANRGGIGGGGIGLFEILIFGALIFGIFWYFKRRRQEAAARAYAQSTAEPTETYQTFNGASTDQVQERDGDPGKGLGYIRQMDSSFDEKKFKDQCMDHFFKIQGAWINRNLSGVKPLLTEEMFGIIHGDAEKLKAEKKVNKLDNIAIRSVDISEVWQETGQDFITVKFYANLLDYVEDESSGQVLSGSKTEPVKFEEYWTFTRPVGNNAWKLSAIQQAE
jgi:predicted lipid-binding transport protein (Tim44 family)